jgi:hypothetical protein
MTPSTQIINDGASLKIISAGASRNILKQQIRELSIVNDTLLKIDIGQGPLNNIFLEYGEVSDPATPNPDALLEAVNAMLVSSASGNATEANQQREISELQNIKTNQLFTEPQLCDESNPRVIYRGFAVPGSATDVAVWAVQKILNNGGVITYQWAAGNKNFDKKWTERKTLIYS